METISAAAVFARDEARRQGRFREPCHSHPGMDVLAGSDSIADRVRTEMAALIDLLDADPELLPPAEDPNSDSYDEEESYITAMVQLTDPNIAASQCILVAEKIKFSAPEYLVTIHEMNGAQLNLHAAPAVRE